MTGQLYLVGTPIGNLEDMTYRAIRILKEADVIAAEDTRTSAVLLNHFDIHNNVTSYHEFNKIEKAKVLVEKMLEGENVALITDAGMPGISDPGEELVKEAYRNGIKVSVIPGPTAFVSAAVISGLSTRRIAFEAFLPKDKKERQRVLSELADETRTMVIYEAPHHLKKTLQELSEVFGSERRISLIRELTKKYEEVNLCTFKEALHLYDDKEPRGEYVLVIEGKSKAEVQAEINKKYENISIKDHVASYINKGYDKKTAMKMAAGDRGLSKRDIYSALLVEEAGDAGDK